MKNQITMLEFCQSCAIPISASYVQFPFFQQDLKNYKNRLSLDNELKDSRFIYSC